MDTSEQEYDDLTLVNGIGEKRQTWLREKMHVYRFMDLAAISANTLQKRLQEIGHPISMKTVNEWIEQARKLSQKTIPLQAQAGEVTSEFRRHYATFTVELLLGEDNDVRRTRVSYVQNKLEETWAGWDEPRLVNFIVQCARLNIPSSKLTSPREPISLHESALSIETESSPARTPRTLLRERGPSSKQKDTLGDVLQVNELVMLPLGSNRPQHIARANEAFNVRVLLDLTEINATPSIPLNCTVTIWAKKLGEGECQIIGEQQSTFLPAEKIPCVAESTISSQGVYRLEALVTLTPEASPKSPSTPLRAWLQSGPIQVYL